MDLALIQFFQIFLNFKNNNYSEYQKISIIKLCQIWDANVGQEAGAQTHTWSNNTLILLYNYYDFKSFVVNIVCAEVFKFPKI